MHPTACHEVSEVHGEVDKSIVLVRLAQETCPDGVSCARHLLGGNIGEGPRGEGTEAGLQGLAHLTQA